MIERFEKGYFASSKAGHDRGTLYVILDRDDRFVYLSDGRLKTVSSPKRKKEKHLQFVAKPAVPVLGRLQEGLAVTDEDVRRSLKLYNQNNSAE